MSTWEILLNGALTDYNIRPSGIFCGIDNTRRTFPVKALYHVEDTMADLTLTLNPYPENQSTVTATTHPHLTLTPDNTSKTSYLYGDRSLRFWARFVCLWDLFNIWPTHHCALFRLPRGHAFCTFLYAVGAVTQCSLYSAASLG